jgi:DNA-binding response OmpR family regulator
MSLVARAKTTLARRSNDPYARPVLVVEDDAGVRAYLVAVLEGQGFRVVSAETAEEALRILESEPAQLAVLDIGLPGQMDGFALAEHLADDVAVIMVTGDPVRALGQERYRVLHKPLVPEALEQAVEAAIEPAPA